MDTLIIILLVIAIILLLMCNIRERRISRTDALTGLYNRRQWDNDYNYTGMLRRKNEPRYLVLIDVDSFKQINDTYGHLYGDSVLKNVARALQCTNGRAYRLGGDEFALLTYDISNIALLLSSVPVSYGISIVVGGDKEDAYNVADKNLYKNKLKNKLKYIV